MIFLNMLKSVRRCNWNIFFSIVYINADSLIIVCIIMVLLMLYYRQKDNIEEKGKEVHVHSM